ncbi:MAG: DegV family protein [Clostridiales bacterium]|nr:DegV family protein [Clostridiales bacterium]
MPYRIFTDSCSDLPVEYIREHDLTVLPLTYSIDGKEYRDDGWTSMPVEEFYGRVRRGSMPTTSLINVQSFLDAFTPCLEKGEDILYIAFSTALSGTCQNGMIAAGDLREQFPERRITVIDSLCASMGLGMLVMLAQQRKEEGMGYDELVAWVDNEKLHAVHWFTVDNLHHLRRGGRLSTTSAFLGTILSIKPVLHVSDEGKLIPVEKVKGRRHALRSLVDRIAQTIVGPEKQTLYIIHGDALEDARMVAQMVRERINIRDITISPIGPVIGSHAGPGTIAVFFMGTGRSI